MNLATVQHVTDMECVKEWITNYANEFEEVAARYVGLPDGIKLQDPEVMPLPAGWSPADLRSIRSRFTCNKGEYWLYFAWPVYRPKSRAVVCLTTGRSKKIFILTAHPGIEFIGDRVEEAIGALWKHSQRKEIKEAIRTKRVEEPNVMDIIYEHITEKGIRVTRITKPDNKRTDTYRLRVHLPRILLYLSYTTDKKVTFDIGQRAMMLEHTLVDPHHGLLWAVDKLVKHFGHDLDQLYIDLNAKRPT